MKGVEVKTDVSLDHWTLGKEFAEWDSDEQAHFLHGMATGFSELGASGHIQLHFVLEKLKEAEGSFLDNVQHFVEQLNEHLTGASE